MSCFSLLFILMSVFGAASASRACFRPGKLREHCFGKRCPLFLPYSIGYLRNQRKTGLFPILVSVPCITMLVTSLCNIQAIFHGSKNVNFQMKFLNIFLTFAKNIDCGYTLEPPH